MEYRTYPHAPVVFVGEGGEGNVDEGGGDPAVEPEPESKKPTHSSQYHMLHGSLERGQVGSLMTTERRFPSLFALCFL